MALKPELWCEIETLYGLGNSAREITASLAERGIKIDHSSIIKKAQKLGWIFGGIHQAINQKVSAIKSQKDAEKKIHQNTPESQLSVVNSLVSQRLAQEGLIKEINSVALKGHRNITILTLNKLRDGKYEPHQAAAVLKLQGLSVENIAKMEGINPADNNGEDDDEDDFLRLIP